MVAWSLASWAALLVAAVVGVLLDPPDPPDPPSPLLVPDALLDPPDPLNPLLVPDALLDRPEPLEPLPLDPPDPLEPLPVPDELPLGMPEGLPVLLLAADSVERIWARAASAL
jgi:hypothetical protein